MYFLLHHIPDKELRVLISDMCTVFYYSTHTLYSILIIRMLKCSAAAVRLRCSCVRLRAAAATIKKPCFTPV